MKGIPLSDKEYEASKAMMDSFRPEKLHKKGIKNGNTDSNVIRKRKGRVAELRTGKGLK